MGVHTSMQWSPLPRNFFCNLTWGSAIATKPRSPTTTCGERWTEEEEAEEEEEEEEKERGGGGGNRFSFFG